MEDRFDMFIYLISGINKNIQRIRSDKANEEGIKTVNTIWLLQMRNEPDGITANELAQKCLVDKSLISRELVQMEHKGLIRCDMVLEETKFIRKIFLTEKGKQIADKFSGIAQKIQSIVNTGINSDDLKTFYRVLRVFYDRIESEAEGITI
jgi:DNA-binding MarR family transcriptional regulator